MVIAFSTNKVADKAGIYLTKKFSNWIEEMTEEGKRIEIVNVNSSGSNNGWMMIVQYHIIENSKKS
jgi:hypothetical protein